MDTHSEVSIFEVLKADAKLAEKLNLSHDDKIWHVKRVRFIKQKPVNLEETWMPLALFPDLTWEVMENSKYHYVEQIKKLVIDRSEQELVPIMPSEEAIAALSLDPAKPILEKVSRGFLKDGRVFEYSRNVLNTDDYKFTLVARRRQ